MPRNCSPLSTQKPGCQDGRTSDICPLPLITLVRHCVPQKCDAWPSPCSVSPCRLRVRIATCLYVALFIAAAGEPRCHAALAGARAAAPALGVCLRDLFVPCGSRIRARLHPSANRARYLGPLSVPARFPPNNRRCRQELAQDEERAGSGPARRGRPRGVYPGDRAERGRSSLCRRRGEPRGGREAIASDQSV